MGLEQVFVWLEWWQFQNFYFHAELAKVQYDEDSEGQKVIGRAEGAFLIVDQAHRFERSLR
jgi:hypothetical protein